MENNNDLKTYEKWDELDLKEELLRGIYGYGFESPSQIQKIAIKPIIDKKDVIAQAQSGTGKTGTFTISSLQRIDITEKNTQVMILAPTHELVKQIAFVVENIGSAMDGLVVKTLVGGTSVNEDIKQLKENVPHVVVGSTGRVNDMIRRRHLQTNHIKLFILDEADEMLSGGFKEQVYQIFQNLSSEAQIAIFSATLPPYILEMTDKFMNNPVKITMEPEKLNLEGIEQFYLALNDDNEKYDTLKKLFDFLTVNQSIIYVNSVQRVEDLYNAMVADGYSVVSIHSSMKREEREKSFNTTLDLAGIPRDPNLVHHGFFDESGGFNSVARMLKLGENSPTAFYAANDLMAVGIIRALKKNNIRVPEDISVIGTNNAPISEYAQPAISTVDVPYAKMAGKAVEMLIEKIEQGEMSQTNFTLECSLVLRDSTAEFQN